MHLQESGEMYLETILVLSKKAVPSVLWMWLSTWLYKAECQPGDWSFEKRRICHHG